MFRGVKPAAQPRTARSNAERKAAPSNFDGGIEYVPQAGMPASFTGANDTYCDSAVEAARAGGSTPRADIPTPFVVTRPPRSRRA